MHPQDPSRPTVIIGGGGFIGRRLAPALLAAGATVEVYTRDRPFAGRAGLAAPVRAADVVFYLATSINLAVAEQHPQWAADDHRRFAALLAALGGVDRPPAVVLASSGGTVYDPLAPPPYTEQSPLRHSSLYAAAKIALEEELQEAAAAVPGVILRLSNVYGPGQRPRKGQGVLAYWLQAVAGNAALRVMGDPANTLDYVYIDDVVSCLCLVREAQRQRAFRPGTPPLILNIGSGEGTSLTRLVEVVTTVVGRELPVERQSVAPGASRPHVWLDCGQAALELGWRARTPLEHGVRAMWHEVSGAPPDPGTPTGRLALASVAPAPGTLG
jgi:UDP-glucose 4-epimerase